jgi:hypothetical protein
VFYQCSIRGLLSARPKIVLELVPPLRDNVPGAMMGLPMFFENLESKPLEANR